MKSPKTTKPSRIGLIFVLSLFLIVGAGITLHSQAATPFISAEPENGSIIPPANQITDSTASGGSAVNFAGGSGSSDIAGIFITKTELARAKTRAASTTEPYRSNYNVQKSRADSALTKTPSPFYMERSNYLANIKWGWGWSSCPDSNVSDNNSVQDAVTKLQDQGALTQQLAIQYALSGDAKYADKAKQYLNAWSTGSTPVNMYDFIANKSTFDGGLIGDDGTTCKRPWNMALDGLFQGYGLINFADSYSLLKNNGYTFTATEDANIRAYLLELAAAVNSSFQSWSVWADKHNCIASNTSDTCIRYRSDNHLSWGQAPLLAAAAALENQTIANYVLNGGTWDDGHSGPVANTSGMKPVINRAILANGQIYDEAPGSVGGIEREGYAFYHLWAMQLAARIDEVNFKSGLWDYKGTDGKGLQDAYIAEAPRIFSGQNDGDNWQYEVPYNRWPNTAVFLQARNNSSRNAYIDIGWGPIVLFVGQ